jgi:site-specific DNA-methyltransferase (adenine-specific)
VNTIKIYQKDAMEFLQAVDDETVDVIVTDPPYWTLDKWRNVGTTTRLGGHRNKDEQRDDRFFDTIDRDYLWELFLELDRVLKLDGHMYMFCDDQVAPILLNWIREAQDEHRFGEAHMLIWDKVNQGMGYHYRRRYECVIFAWREIRDGVRGFKKRKLRDLGMADILTYKRVTNGYPTEKPSALVQDLLTQSARVGDTLLDPFAGSGVLGAATPFDYNAKILLNDKSQSSMAWMQEKTFPPLTRDLVNLVWLDDAAKADADRQSEVERAVGHEVNPER